MCFRWLGRGNIWVYTGHMRKLLLAHAEPEWFKLWNLCSLCLTWSGEHCHAFSSWAAHCSSTSWKHPGWHQLGGLQRSGHHWTRSPNPPERWRSSVVCRPVKQEHRWEATTAKDPQVPPPPEIQSHHVHKVDNFKHPLPHCILISLQLLVLKGNDIVKQLITQMLTLVTTTRPPSYHTKIANEVEFQVFLLLDNPKALPATRHFLTMSHCSFYGKVTGKCVTPDLERLRPVGGSKSSLQLVLVTPQTPGVELPALRVITAWLPSSPPDRGSIRYLWADVRKYPLSPDQQKIHQISTATRKTNKTINSRLVNHATANSGMSLTVASLSCK